eukprot:1196101-Prorocentrum_minimum.AAC.9
MLSGPPTVNTTTPSGVHGSSIYSFILFNPHVTPSQPATNLLRSPPGDTMGADPATKQWLSENLESVFGFPSVVRFSWGTTKQLLEATAVRVEW